MVVKHCVSCGRLFGLTETVLTFFAVRFPFSFFSLCNLGTLLYKFGSAHRSMSLVVGLYGGEWVAGRRELLAWEVLSEAEFVLEGGQAVRCVVIRRSRKLRKDDCLLWVIVFFVLIKVYSRLLDTLMS